MMMRNNVSVTTLIENAITNQDKFLDLGNCNLNDKSIELEHLKECTFLEGLNLGTYYYENNVPVYAKSTGERNYFSRIPSTIPTSLKTLFINKTGISDISEINKLTQLTFFDSFGNNIDNLQNLVENPNLISLGLSDNNINGSELINLTKFINLKFLYLGNNPLRTILVNSQKALPNLERVYLYNTKISSIEFLLGNKTIKEIYLNKNEIKDIDIIKNLIYLTTIDLTNNPVTIFTPDFAITTDATLIRSKLKNQSFVSTLIEENVIKKETFLDLGNCFLSNVSEELNELKKLTHLRKLNLGFGYYDDNANYVLSVNRLEKNNFTQIPDNLPIGLLELQIRDNAIRTISNLDNLTNLELLDLSYNSVNSMRGVEVAKNLKEIALHNNNITTLIKLPNLKKLSVLHLSNNPITHLAPIESYTSLREAYLYSGKITEIKRLTLLKNLAVINISNNPIEDCPPDIWQNNDINQIKAYFTNKEIEAKKIEKSNENLVTDFIDEKENKSISLENHNQNQLKKDYKDIKLILLGNSSNGKTNMVHFLETGEFLKTRKSTHGLDVKRWIPNTEIYPQLKNIVVSIWDFGGQEYYHDAYRLFMRSDAIYMIVWCKDTDINAIKTEKLIDNGLDVQIEHFEKQYWLDTIKYFSNYDINYPLFLVQNKVDDMLKDRVKIGNSLMEKYNITDSFHLSLKNGVNPENQKQVKNLHYFTDYLADTITEQVNKNSHHTSGFQSVRELIALAINGEESCFSDKIIEDLYIPIDQFQKACSQITNENTTFFPQWLDSGGMAIYFDKNDKLKDKLFINPKRISEKMYEILSLDILNSNGEIEGDKINDSNSDINFVEIMKSLNLIYDHPNKPGFYIAPQYLPKQHPIEDLFKIASFNTWNDSFWIKTSMFFYKKILHRLLLHFINDKNSDAKYYWKEGLIFIKNETRVLIKGLFTVTSGESKIQISIENTNQRIVLNKELVSIIASLFNTENKDNTVTPNTKENVQIGKTDFSSSTNFYLEHIEFSVDNEEFILYNKLLEFSVDTTKYKNEIYKYQHIYDFGNSYIPKKVFVSYSHQNTKYVTKLRNHLAGLRRSNLIKDWTDREILPGEKWDKKIKDELNNADVVIMLLSADFFASDYIWDYELKGAFEGVKKIIPIYVEPFDLAAIPQIDDTGLKIGSFEIIPKNDQEQLLAISLWQNEAEAFKKITERIRLVLNQ